MKQNTDLLPLLNFFAETLRNSAFRFIPSSNPHRPDSASLQELFASAVQTFPTFLLPRKVSHCSKNDRGAAFRLPLR
jgi:hypothetical protein